MKYAFANSALAALTLSSTVLGSPLHRRFVNDTEACAEPITLSGNAFLEHTLHATSKYRGQVEAAVKDITDQTLAESAAKVADIGTFQWM